MKILILSDVESKFLWDFFEPDKLDGIDLIISCGDLEANYLSFLATFTKSPVLYVPGNHDTRYADAPPEGCVDIDGKVFVHKGIRIAGLGGSMSYSKKAYQYTEFQMTKRFFKLLPKILFQGGLDIFVAHAPAAGLGDAEDLPHKGFKIFLRIMDIFKPTYFFHGHMHLSYNYKQKRQMEYKDTTIYNAFERYIVEIPDKK